MSSFTRGGLIENLRGVIEIMCAKRSGLHRMDLSAAGFLISFIPLGIAWLLEASVYSVDYGTTVAQLADQEVAVHWSAIGYMLTNLAIFVLAYAVGMFAIYLAANEGERQHMPVVITVHNWAAPLVALVVFPFLLVEPESDISLTLFAVLFVSLLALMCYAYWQIVTISTDTTKSRGAWLFVLSFVTQLVVFYTLEEWTGLAAFAVPAT